MLIINVKPGVDQQALSDMARHYGLRVGIQGGMQVLIADSSKRVADLTPIRSVPDIKK